MALAWKSALAATTLLGLSVAAAQAASTTTTMYSYTYAGPAFKGGGNVAVSFTVPSPLGKSAVYSGLPTGTYVGTISLVAPSAASDFSLTIQTFALATDANGNILSWAIGATSSNLGKGVPATGSTHLLWSIDTHAKPLPLPNGSDDATVDDWATTTNYYRSCTGVAGCTVHDGQPSVVTYSAQALGGGGKWTMTPVKITVSCSSGGSGKSGNCPPYHAIVELGD